MGETAYPGPMPLWRQIGLASGDFGFNLYWTTASLFLLYFYTDVLKLPTATAGLIYMIALVLDGCVDPLIGALADRTRTRFGRYRPYLLFCGIPLAAAFAALFVGPVWPAAGAALFAGMTHAIFRIGYSVIGVPYTALFARVTRDSGERAQLAGFRMMGATLCAVVVSVGTLPLVEALGQGDARRGWALTAALYGTVATAIFWLSAWSVRGLDKVEATPPERADPARVARALATNTPFLLVLALFVVSQFSSVFFQNNLIYYCKYVLGDAKLAGLALMLMALELAVLVPVWVVVARRRGKRFAWLAGAVFHMTGLALWALAGGAPVGLQFAAMAVMSVGTASAIVCLWAMLPDTVEYGQWRAGLRTESLIFGLVTLGQKAALGLSGWVLGLSLRAIGYAPGAAQTPQTLSALHALMVWPPLAGSVIGIGLVALYRLDPETHAAIVADIAAREAEAKLTPVL